MRTTLTTTALPGIGSGRVRFWGCALLAAGLGLVMAGPTHARALETRSVHFSAPFTDAGTRPSGLGACSPTQPGVCSVRLEGVADFTGALSTFVDYFGYARYNPATRTVVGETWDHHTGSLKGCGEGSFVLHQTDIQGDPATFNPATGTFHLTLKWTVLPGSGTGAFAGASGSGTAVGDFKPDFANTGVYSGEIICRVPA